MITDDDNINGFSKIEKIRIQLIVRAMEIFLNNLCDKQLSIFEIFRR